MANGFWVLIVIKLALRALIGSLCSISLGSEALVVVGVSVGRANRWLLPARKPQRAGANERRPSIDFKFEQRGAEREAKLILI